MWIYDFRALSVIIFLSYTALNHIYMSGNTEFIYQFQQHDFHGQNEPSLRGGYNQGIQLSETKDDQVWSFETY